MAIAIATTGTGTGANGALLLSVGPALLATVTVLLLRDRP